MDETVRIGLPSDDEGYVSFQCQHCRGRFKLHAGEVDRAAAETLYCPLCGLSGEPGSFLTSEVIEVAQAHARRMAEEAIGKMFKDLESKTRGNKFVRFKASPRPPQQPIPKLQEVTDLALVEYSCCGNTAKLPHSDAISGSYCPFCGSERA